MSINIYAITDSHQESRNLSRLLGGIYTNEKDGKNPVLVLDAGDLFKGIYDKNLSVNAYIKLKELLPRSEIFITIGNNDFGFKKADFEYLKQTVQNFKSAGINVVCSNVIDSKTGKNVYWLDEYKIIELDGKKILITGFCLNNSCAKKFGCTLISPADRLPELLSEIKEPYDRLIILNHHWKTESENLYDSAKRRGINIDLIIGGHEHSPIEPDYEKNIFYPLSFARAMYKMRLDDKISKIQQVPAEDIAFAACFEEPVIEYEKRTGLKDVLTKRILNLPKCYSEPCPLGTFISDRMKEAGNTEIAFHSTGFTMYPLRTSDSDIITKYDLMKVICAGTAIEKADLKTGELLKVFENAGKFRMFKDRGNAQFLQCSRNVKITGHGNLQDNSYKILQIEINGEKLLDKNSKPVDSKRKISCTFDKYIGAGEQGFEILKNIPKTKILKNGEEIFINDLFYNTVIEENQNHNGATQLEYPSFVWADV